MTHLFDDETVMRNHDYQLERKAEQAGIAKGIEQGMKQGIEQGIEQGIHALVATVKKLSQSRDTAVDMVMEQFGLQKQDATDKVAQYWG